MAYQNFFSSKITNDIGAGDTTIIVDNAPTSTSGRMVLEARNTTQREIIKYTGLSGNTLTGVTRGQGGTSAKSHVAGALIQQNATAEDLQDLYDAFASFSVSSNDWRTLVPAVTGVTANGNRSYDITFASTVAAILSNGMRLRTERTVSAPTQCTSLNGTTQYYSCASATVSADMTWTDDFAAGIWMKIPRYNTAESSIQSRLNASSGWHLALMNTGQIFLSGYNASYGNNSRVISRESIPSNKWVYVTAQLDMSAFTATTTTSYIMIDGMNVPAYVSRVGTNPTALVQAGDYEVGAYNGANQPFLGKISQAWVSNAKVPQANVLTLYSQGLTPALITANNIVSAYSFNNDITDLNTTSANNLTANGSAVATEADSFAGTQADGTISSTYDYAVVTKVNGTVVTVQVPAGCTIPTSGGITGVSYSGVEAPYGFPLSKLNWRVSKHFRAAWNQGIGATVNWGNAPFANVLVAPTGSWTVGVDGCISFVSTVSGARNAQFCLAYAEPPAAYGTAPGGRPTVITAVYVDWSGKSEANFDFTTPTTFNLYQYLYSASGSESWAISGLTETVFYADTSYI